MGSKGPVFVCGILILAFAIVVYIAAPGSILKQGAALFY